jgi:hypothetical protein
MAARGDLQRLSVNRYRGIVTRTLRTWTAVAVLSSLAPLTFLSTPGLAATASRTCHAPRLTGLTVATARAKARVAGCPLRLTGARLQMPTIQTIHTQSVRPGRVAKVVTVSVNPLCPGALNIGPPPGEPIVKSGPTELISGLFIVGGAFIYRSAPNCKVFVGKSSGGTITITNSVGTVFANNMALAPGQLLYVNVPAGSYTITGVFSGGEKAGPTTVTVASGEIVRQDLVLDVP